MLRGAKSFAVGHDGIRPMSLGCTDCAGTAAEDLRELLCGDESVAVNVELHEMLAELSVRRHGSV